ncbi:MAG: 4-hydroxy-3-methylbut-2-enyl diphosphate reductase, partial [Erysipelotrichaceae bacterium]|nr:4-hydroxy-3-methylbut-2-enyl diphosphate reductase [Erysipelotrichaceae bacterium]
IVSQTTFNFEKFHFLVEQLKKISYYSRAVNTICNATQSRQSEARELAARADVMIVIGGKHSSNTQKLYEICKNECSRTYFVQTVKDLSTEDLPFGGVVGITAGASTPINIIEEVGNLCLS